MFKKLGLVLFFYSLSMGSVLAVPSSKQVEPVDPPPAPKTSIVEGSKTSAKNALKSVSKKATNNGKKALNKVKSSRPTKGVKKALKKVKTKKGAKKPMTATTSKEPIVEIKTNLGSMKVKLYPEKAPGTVKNFLHYVEEKYYNKTIFHRVISNFMIQGGGFIKNADGIVQKPTEKPIKIESNNGLKNKRGSIAMARTNIPDSATSQFFINVGENSFLDYPGQDGHGYTVFGETVDDESLAVVDKIKAVETAVQPLNGSPQKDVPVKDVVIESITLL